MRSRMTYRAKGENDMAASNVHGILEIVGSGWPSILPASTGLVVEMMAVSLLVLVCSSVVPSFIVGL